MSSSAAPRRDSADAAASALVLTLHRNGTVIRHNGRELAGLTPRDAAAGQPIERLWPDTLAALVRRLMRRALSARGTTQTDFEFEGRRYRLAVSARGPDCLDCQVSASAMAPTVPTAARLQRREFLGRLKESIAIATLRELPLALAVVEVDGIRDIAQVLEAGLGRRLMDALLTRLRGAELVEGDATGYFGELREGVLALILESSDRAAVQRATARLCARLREPVALGDGSFHLTPYAGVAILGQDAVSPRTLLAHARRAAVEARARSMDSPCFFADTLQLESLARLDIARELREAMLQQHIGLRYVGRYELSTGRLVARVGYLRWQHPLRGDIRPSEFLRVAETTGLAINLSRAGLAGLQQDHAALGTDDGADVRISFGPLRHHVLHEHFVRDVESFLAHGAVPPARLELRIAEKTFIACRPALLKSLHALGVRLIVDEVAREMGSLDGLARAPIWGLQLDRAWVTALRSEEPAQKAVALKVCRAAIAVASALDLQAIATGIDTVEQRDALLSLGCPYGAGDFYRDGSRDAERT